MLQRKEEFYPVVHHIPDGKVDVSLNVFCVDFTCLFVPHVQIKKSYTLIRGLRALIPSEDFGFNDLKSNALVVLDDDFIANDKLGKECDKFSFEIIVSDIIDNRPEEKKQSKPLRFKERSLKVINGNFYYEALEYERIYLTLCGLPSNDLSGEKIIKLIDSNVILRYRNHVYYATKWYKLKPFSNVADSLDTLTWYDFDEITDREQEFNINSESLKFGKSTFANKYFGFCELRENGIYTSDGELIIY